MKIIRIWLRLKQQFATTSLLALFGASALLIASLALAFYNDSLRKEEAARRTQVQAQIIANSVAAALAFEDMSAIQEYLKALKSNPEVDAAGVYDAQGRLVAGFGGTQPLPVANMLAAPHINGHYLIVTTKVQQENVLLGSVYLRTVTQPLRQRLIGYAGIGTVIFMAALLVTALGSSHASMGEAHRKLQQEIKDREKAEAALLQAQKMEAMGQLTGGIAHDFNNLLMVASSALELMLRTTDPVRREQLQQSLRKVIERGGRLTQQLLAFARRTPLKPQVVDLSECLNGIRELLDRSLREDIVVSLQLDDNLWPVEIDTSQLEVSILNIAFNARDAMPEGGTLALSATNVKTPDKPDRVRLDITDSGSGVPTEIIGRVFEPFFTTKEVGRGTGLGLSQVYGFVRASGGDVAIDSIVGHGTTITLLFPRVHRVPVAITVPIPPPVPALAARRYHVLLVEDDDGVAESVTDMLSELGYDCTRVATPTVALQVLRAKQTVDIVLSDMVMPGPLSGLDLAHTMGTEWPHLPVILTTGYSAAVASATAEGLRLLIKPYRMLALDAELQAALAAARALPGTDGLRLSGDTA